MKKIKKILLICFILIVSPIVFIVLHLLITLVSCLLNGSHYGIRNETQYIVGEDSNTEGFNEICLYEGDTISILRTGDVSAIKEYRGSYFNFYDDSIMRKKFVMSEWPYSTLIEGHISDYIINDTFLLADQKPVDSILGKYIRDENGVVRRSKDYYYNLHDLDNALKESPIHQFWIINHVSKDVYGPFSYEEYLLKKKELKVNPELKLKYENNYQP